MNTKRSIKDQLKAATARKARLVDLAEERGDMDAMVNEMTDYVKLLNLGHALGTIKPAKIKIVFGKRKKPSGRRSGRNKRLH